MNEFGCEGEKSFAGQLNESCGVGRFLTVEEVNEWHCEGAKSFEG